MRALRLLPVLLLLPLLACVELGGREDEDAGRSLDDAAAFADGGLATADAAASPKDAGGSGADAAAEAGDAGGAGVDAAAVPCPADRTASTRSPSARTATPRPRP
jgi:hypothetical protein